MASLSKQLLAHALQAGGDQHQRYLLLCALLKHSDSREVGSTASLAVLEQAGLEADALEPTMAFPALVYALKVPLGWLPLLIGMLIMYGIHS